MRQLRRRYLALRVESDKPLHGEAVMDAIWGMVYQLFGEVGASQTALYRVAWDDKQRVLTVRCSHKMLGMVKAAIAAVTTIGEEECALCVLAVSGTLKALRRKLSRESDFEDC